VDEKSLAHGRRIVRVNQELLEEIAELTGIRYSTLSSAFLSFPPEPKDEVLNIVKAAVLASPDGDPEEWQRYILNWAKENRKGMYRPAILGASEITHEYTEHERRVREGRA
jgi:hypothetical protein